MENEMEQFYEERLNLFQDNLKSDLGQFNVLDIDEQPTLRKHKNCSYRRRAFYKIKLFTGNFIYHFSGKTVEINGSGLIFINPDTPYGFSLIEEGMTGYMCIFTEEFINKFGNIKEYPIFKPDGNPIFILETKEIEEFKQLFFTMQDEIKSDYLYKYDVLRNMVFEIIHKAMKLRPQEVAMNRGSNANSRIVSLFTELLELQFPIEKSSQVIRLRTAKDFAHQLSVHVNHLNRVIKKETGKTTSQYIMERLHQESRVLLKQTDWNISEIGYRLGFEDTSHFISTFKKVAGLTPRIYREK